MEKASNLLVNINAQVSEQLASSTNTDRADSEALVPKTLSETITTDTTETTTGTNSTGSNSLAEEVNNLVKVTNNNSELSEDQCLGLWAEVVNSLKNTLDRQIFLAWFKPLRLVACKFYSQPTASTGEGHASANNTPADKNLDYCEAVIAAPNKFCCDHIERNHRKTIQLAFQEKAAIENLTLSFIINDIPLKTYIEDSGEDSISRESRFNPNLNSNLRSKGEFLTEREEFQNRISPSQNDSRQDVSRPDSHSSDLHQLNVQRIGYQQSDNSGSESKRSDSNRVELLENNQSRSNHNEDFHNQKNLQSGFNQAQRNPGSQQQNQFAANPPANFQQRSGQGQQISNQQNNNQQNYNQHNSNQQNNNQQNYNPQNYRGYENRHNQNTPNVHNSGRPAIKTDSNKLNYDETNLNHKYNFSNYIVGACNQFAHAVSLRVAENLGSNFNPLFIYGGVGLGKTHLANAIGNALFRRGKNVLLVSSEVFVSELISALRSNRMQDFKNKFRSLDLLVIDDIQFIIGKERTQEEFFHTFNELHQRFKQIILTSDKVPQELIGLEERLMTRFASGIAVDLQTPDYETRVAILIKKAETFGISLSEEVAIFIAEKITTNVRELEGALNRIQAQSSLLGQPITVDLSDQVLQSLLPTKINDLTVEGIQRYVAEKMNVSIQDLVGKRRTQNIAYARQLAMFLCRKFLGCSFPEIGAIFGGRDHATAIHACKVIEERMDSDKFLKDTVDKIKGRS